MSMRYPAGFIRPGYDPLTLANDADWQTYRQALRDVPTQEGFPWSVTWPEQP